jgi:hypothetical protein
MWYVYAYTDVLASVSEVRRPSRRLFRRAWWIPQRDARED